LKFKFNGFIIIKKDLKRVIKNAARFTVIFKSQRFKPFPAVHLLNGLNAVIESISQSV